VKPAQRLLTGFAAGLVILLPAHAVLAQSDADTTQDKAAEAAAPGGDIRSEGCLECHAEDPDAKVTFGDGSSRAVLVDRKTIALSVHGGALACTDCHRDIARHPHAPVKARDARAYTLDESRTCRRCHYAYYTRVLDGIHFKVLESGNRNAPTCVDCHGAHDVQDPKGPRVEVSQRCARCHDKVYAAYAGSVHGRAMLEEANTDVPVCTDCHGAHAIANPKEPTFRTTTHQMCAKCHGDATKMAKYNLNPEVVSSYLQDFHGVSNSLYSEGATKVYKPMATCTDCHGIHDIEKFSSGDKGAIREKVLTVCRGCHEEVPATFGDAWLSHYQPTLASAPMVWSVKWAYRILIPFIMAGLVLHILLHLWRLRAHR